MKWIGFALMGLLFLGQSAAAGPTWSAFAFTTTPQNAPQVVAATDKFMNSPIGKEFPGRLMLHMYMANGSNPATHALAPFYKSAADREVYVQKVMADPAWADYQAAMARISQPVSQVMLRTLRSWGEIVDSDPVWVSLAYAVKDPDAFVAAIDKFMASETGKKFPGQAHLSGVLAGGISPVNTMISIGYASEAEMETWMDSLMGNADWAACLEAGSLAAQPLGNSMGRTLKSWGTVSMGDLTAP
jgi:hypothetical protein